MYKIKKENVELRKVLGSYNLPTELPFMRIVSESTIIFADKPKNLNKINGFVFEKEAKAIQEILNIKP